MKQLETQKGKIMTRRPTQTTVTGRLIGGGVFQPRANENDPDRERYNACLVLDKDEENKVREIVEQAKSERWGNKPPAGLQDWGVREGDDPEYETSYQKLFINPKSTKPPEVLFKPGSAYVRTTQEDGVVYPGCYVALSIGAYAYDGDKKKSIKPGVTLNLRAVLFRKNGARLDDYMDAESEFAGVSVEAANDDEDDFLAA